MRRVSGRSGILVKEKTAQANSTSNHWSSTENSTNNSWNVNFSSGNTNNNNKYNNNVVRAVAALSEEEIESWIKAYNSCCANKKTSPQCTFYRIEYEYDLLILAAQVKAGFLQSQGQAEGIWTKVEPYRPTTSVAFCVSRPKLREIFAANFRDRIAQHYIILRLEPLLEARFHEQGDVSYNCRKGFGTLRAVTTLQAFCDRMTDMAEEMPGEEPYVAKFDIHSFFMSIDVEVLWRQLEPFIRQRYKGDDLELLVWLTRLTIFHRPQTDCERRGDLRLWDNLPASKSLFGSDRPIGMPIGNITSQQFANFYMSFFDEWATEYCRTRGWFYIRFVDDIVVAAPTRAMAERMGVQTADDGTPLGRQLTRLHRLSSAWLQENLHLTLHPDKLYIQPIRHGVKFVGSVIMPHRTYLIGRTYDTLRKTLLQLNEACCIYRQDYIQHWLDSRRSRRQIGSRFSRAVIPEPAFGKTRLSRTLLIARPTQMPQVKQLLRIEHLTAGANSLMGFTVHCNSYARRRRMFAKYLDPAFYGMLSLRDDFRKISIRRRYQLPRFLARMERRQDRQPIILNNSKDRHGIIFSYAQSSRVPRGKGPERGRERKTGTLHHDPDDPERGQVHRPVQTG